MGASPSISTWRRRNATAFQMSPARKMTGSAVTNSGQKHVDFLCRLRGGGEAALFYRAVIGSAARFPVRVRREPEDIRRAACEQAAETQRVRIW